MFRAAPKPYLVRSGPATISGLESALRAGVIAVLLWGACEEMGWIAAARIIAGMTDKVACRYGTMGQFVRQAVCPMVAAAYSDLAIAIVGRAPKWPAGIGSAALVYQEPEIIWTMGLGGPITCKTTEATVCPWLRGKHFAALFTCSLYAHDAP